MHHVGGIEKKALAERLADPQPCGSTPWGTGPGDSTSPAAARTLDRLDLDRWRDLLLAVVSTIPASSSYPIEVRS